MKQLATTVNDVERACLVVAKHGQVLEKVNTTVEALEEDQQHMRKTLHTLAGAASTNGMRLEQIIKVNDIQTPILQRLDRVVMGDGDLTERVRDYGKRFNKWDRVVMAVLIAIATGFGTWVVARFTASDLRQWKNEQKQVQAEGMIKQ